MSLNKKGLLRVESIYPDLVHEFFGSSDEYSRCQLFATIHLSKSVQDGKFLCQDWTAVGDWSGSKGEFERKIEFGFLFRSNLVQISRKGSEEEMTKRMVRSQVFVPIMEGSDARARFVVAYRLMTTPVVPDFS